MYRTKATLEPVGGLQEPGGSLESKSNWPQGSACSCLIRAALFYCMRGSERTCAGQATKEELLVHHRPQTHTKISVPSKTQTQIGQWQKAAVGKDTILAPGRNISDAHPLERWSSFGNYFLTTKDHVPQIPNGPGMWERGFCSHCSASGEGCSVTTRGKFA